VASGFESGVALGIPLLYALLTELVDLGTGLAQLFSVFGGAGFGLGNGF